jgi:catalase
VIWNEAVKIAARTPISIAATCGSAIEAGDFPEWDLGVQLFDEDFAEQLRPSTCSTRPRSSPRRGLPVRDRRHAHARPQSSTISSPRPSRSPSARRMSCPGIDFSNDPLLQGRNFSYLDTQLKRLGGPNFTHPDQRAQGARLGTSSRTGTWRCAIPRGRVNYEPNSWGDMDDNREPRGPRASPERGFTSYAAPVAGPQGARAQRDLRRSLQPGAPVLHLADRDRADPHGRCAGLRALEGDPRRHPRDDGRPSAQHRRGR